MFERFLVLWLTLLSGLAYCWPANVADPFAGSRPFVPWLIAVTMFFVGCLMKPRELADVLRNWPWVLFGTAVQYLSMPLLGWLFTRLPGLSPDLRLGVIVAACVPDAMASGAVTLMAHGNVSYSVSLTTCSTLLSPIVAPFAMQSAAGRDVAVDALEISQTLLLQVVGPVLLGHLICRRAPDSQRLQRISSTLAYGSILWIIAVVVGLNRERIAELFFGARSREAGLLLLALLGVNLGGYLSGYVAATWARLDEPKRRALSLTVGLQNAGLGTSLILTVFPEHPGAAIPTALYTFGSMWTGALLAEFWRRRGAGPMAATAPAGTEHEDAAVGPLSSEGAH